MLGCRFILSMNFVCIFFFSWCYNLSVCCKITSHRSLSLDSIFRLFYLFFCVVFVNFSFVHSSHIMTHGSVSPLIVVFHERCIQPISAICHTHSRPNMQCIRNSPLRGVPVSSKKENAILVKLVETNWIRFDSCD